MAGADPGPFRIGTNRVILYHPFRSTDVMSLRTQSATASPLDRFAIAFSGVCAVHCVLIVLAITSIPIWGLGWLTAPHFHEWFLALALAPSAVALWSGYRRHRRTTVIGGGIAALTLMALAIVLREQALISEHGESVLTLSGAGLLAATHWRNLRLHGNEDCCASGA